MMKCKMTSVRIKFQVIIDENVNIYYEQMNIQNGQHPNVVNKISASGKKMVNITIYKSHNKIHLKALQWEKTIQDKIEGFLKQIVNNAFGLIRFFHAITYLLKNINAYMTTLVQIL